MGWGRWDGGLPIGGLPALSRVVNCAFGQRIRLSVKFAVNVADDPAAATSSERFAQLVTLLQEDAQMSAVAPPLACHKHDDEHGVKLKDQMGDEGPPKCAVQARTKAEELGDVLG